MNLTRLQLAAILPAKTVPSRGGRIHSDARNLRKKKRTKSRKDVIRPVKKKSRVTVEEVDDDDEPSQTNISKSTERDGSPSTSN